MLETPGDASAPDLPEWFMPPRIIGGYVTGPVPIARSGRLVIVARQVLALPAGVEVEAHAHGSRAGTAPVPADLPGHLPLQFGVRFADGHQAARDDETGLHGGRGPMLMVTGAQISSGGPDDPRMCA